MNEKKIKNTDVEAITENKSRSKVVPYILLVIFIFFFVVSLINYLYINFDFTFGINSHKFFYFTFISQRFTLAFGALFVFIYLIKYFINFMKKKNGLDFEFNLHTISGIIGVLTFFITYSIILFSIFDSLGARIACFIALFLSTFLCLYCSSVWCYIKLKSRLKEPMIGNFIFGFLFFGIVSYFVDGYSGLLINDIFSVNSKYFPFTKSLISLIIISPVLAFICLLTIIAVVFMIFRGKWSASAAFYKINIFISTYLLFSLSLYLMSSNVNLINMVSSNFDFDSKSPCEFIEEYSGFIVLDPAHTKVLVFNENELERYKVKACKVD
ncbi:hypothetical protein [Pseudoalteromonas gelatinilytica]